MPDATLPSTIDALHAALDENPSDGATRRVLADAYRERGGPGDEAAAEAMEWAGLCGKRPYHIEAYRDWGWVWCGTFTGGDENAVPEPLFGLLESESNDADYRTQYTRRAAEEALCAAWGLLPAAERERLLKEARK